MVLIHHITCYIDLRGLSLISTETTNKINHVNTLDKPVNNTHFSTAPVKTCIFLYIEAVETVYILHAIWTYIVYNKTFDSSVYCY